MPIRDCDISPDARVFQPDLVNLYGCEIGARSQIGPFVEIQSGCVIGEQCKVSSHSFLCEGVTLEDGVFVGHGVMFTNDIYPESTNSDGSLKSGEDWVCSPVHVGQGASLGSNATILGGVKVGTRALVGAGAVVTRDVPDFAIVAGVPARVIGDVREKKITDSAQGSHSESERLT